MKMFLFFLLMAVATPTLAFSDPAVGPSPVASVQVAAAPAPAPSVVPVAEPAAPPQWAQDVMVSAQKLPVVGPIVSKALLYLGIISSILTMLVTFLLGAIKTLSAVLNYAGLASAAGSISAFQNSKIMYWIKFLSMFNAKKPEPL